MEPRRHKDGFLRDLEQVLVKHSAWIFFDCKGGVLWANGEPVGRFDTEAADDFRLALTDDLYGCDDDA